MAQTAKQNVLFGFRLFTKVECCGVVKIKPSVTSTFSTVTCIWSQNYKSVFWRYSENKNRRVNASVFRKRYGDCFKRVMADTLVHTFQHGSCCATAKTLAMGNLAKNFIRAPNNRLLIFWKDVVEGPDLSLTQQGAHELHATKSYTHTSSSVLFFFFFFR